MAKTALDEAVFAQSLVQSITERLERAIGGGEALEMADLQHEAALHGECRELIGLGERRRDRLLDQDVLAGAERSRGRGGSAARACRQSRARDTVFTQVAPELGWR